MITRLAKIPEKNLQFLLFSFVVADFYKEHYTFVLYYLLHLLNIIYINIINLIRVQLF